MVNGVDAMGTFICAALYYGTMKQDPEEVLGTVRAAVDDFVGTAEQFDDLTMVCLKYKGPESGNAR